MINVMTAFGTSFKGLTAYLMHDVDHAQTSERVAWTHSHNIATDDPERAARIMAATAMSQSELKESAGIKNTGRKSDKHVMHYVLSWAPDEYGEYSKDELLDAALASMTYIGAYEGERIGKKRVSPRTQYANEHQALIVCHDEGPGSNPHVHVMVNRVHPQHGVMVSDSKDFEKLSAWSLDYRKSQGLEHLCPARVQNAAKRAQGVLVSHPRKPRNIYEREQEIEQSEPGSEKREQLELLAERAKELKFKTERLKKKRQSSMHKIEAEHTKAIRAQRDQAAETIRQKKMEIKTAYTPKIDELSERHSQEMKAFQEAKETATGHVRNAWEAFKTKEWMTDLRSNPVESIKHGFGLAFSSGLQQRDIEKLHTREQGELKGKRRAEELQETREVRADEHERLEKTRSSYLKERNDLQLVQRMEKAKLSAEWNQLERDHRTVQNEGGREHSTELRKTTTPSVSQKFNTKSQDRHQQEDQGQSTESMRDMAAELRTQQDQSVGTDLGKNEPDQGISR